MKKIILKASLITIDVLILVGVLIFGLWILISPDTMATVSEELGNYKFAITCANLNYKYTDDSADLARCAEDSILSGDDEVIVEYCDRFVKISDFDAVCERRNSELAKTKYGKYITDYRSFILSNLSVSKYRCGDLEGAVKSAELGQSQCFFKLVLEIVQKGTTQEMNRVKELCTVDANREFIEKLVADIFG